MRKDMKVNTRTYRMKVSYRQYILSILWTVTCYVGYIMFLMTPVLLVLLYALMESQR